MFNPAGRRSLAESSTSSSRLTAFAACTLAGLLSLAGCGGTASLEPTQGHALSGVVHGGQQPVTGSKIQLYAFGSTGDGSAATALIAATVTTSDGSGNGGNPNANAGNAFNTLPVGAFTITGDYTCPSSASQVYLTATGGNPGLAAGTNNGSLALMAALGNCGSLSSSTNVYVNELTTVGSLAPIAAYTVSASQIGSGSADALQFSQALAEIPEYVNFATGVVPGPTLPAGYYASSTEINTLADILASCINSNGGDGQCANLYLAAMPPGGVAPVDTIGALADILNNPNQNVSTIYGLMMSKPPFQPTLSSAPSNWQLPIVPYAATPAITPATGSYVGPQTINITESSPKSVIYYTTDGSAPTTSSSVYTGSFVVSASATVKALATAAGYATSAVSSSSLTITSAGVASKLAFLTQPSNVAYGVQFSPAVQVVVEDINGNIVTSATGSITLALISNPGNASLGGSTSQPVANGIATFTNLTVSGVGTAYQFGAFGSVNPAFSNPFNVTLYPITVTPADPLLGVGSTLPGTFTLSQPAPAGGVAVALSSSATANATILPATVNVAAGQTTGSFTYTGVATGPVNLVAATTGYQNGTSAITVTNSFVSMGTLPAVTIGQSAPITLTLGAVAPSGGLTVMFSSSNPLVATVTPSVFVPAGVKIATEIPYILGTGPGTATITATAPNFAPDVKTVTLTLGLSLPATVTVPATTATSALLTLSNPAPAGGITVTLSMDKPSIATVPATVTIPAGASTANVLITPVSLGSTTLRADYPGSVEATSAVTVQGTISGTSNLSTGVGLENTNPSFYLQSAPAAPTTFTVTSSNPAVATLSIATTTTGTASISFPNVVSSFGTQYYSVQGISPGTSTITVSGPGFKSITYTTTVYASALVFQSSLTSATIGNTVNEYVTTATLNAALNVISTGYTVNPGGAALTIPVTSSNTAVGTITGSATIAPGQSSSLLQFKGLTAGTTTVTLGAQPVGLSTPATLSYTSQTVTVSAPNLYAYGSSVVGVGLTATSNQGYLPVAPASPVTITVTSSNPAALLVGTGASPSGIGAASVTFPNIDTAYNYVNWNLQGVSVGTSTITVSAPGYTSYTYNVTVGPTAIVFYSSPSFSTTTLSGPTQMTLTTAVLGAGNAILTTGEPLSPNAASVSVTVSSATTTVGTINPAQVTIVAGQSSGSTTFVPAGLGTTVVSLGAQPTGYTNPATGTSGTVTVTAPPIYTSGGITTGVGLTSNSFTNTYLSVAPASGVTVTMTSSNPAVATLGTGSLATAAGTASISFTNVNSAYQYLYFNVQGLTTGTSTVTASAPGYASATFVVTVQPSTLVFSSNQSSTFTTTTFSTPTSLTVTTATLNINGLVSSTGLAINPGASASGITVTSATPSVGTITASPLTIGPGQSSAVTTFKPGSLGTTVISLGAQPAGFSTPPTASSQGTVTVTAPAINTSSSTVTVGAGLSTGGSYSYIYTGLSVTPITPQSITITSSNPAVATLSPGQTAIAAGTSSLVFTNITTTTQQYFNIQGISVGTSTLNITSPGYAPTTMTVTVDPSGFVITSGSINTSTYNTPTPITVSTAILNPSTLAVISTGLPLNYGAATVSIPITSDTASVGTISGSPVSIAAGQSNGTANFQPVGAGSAVLTLGAQPAGFSPSSQNNYQYVVATVTAPTLLVSSTSNITAGSSYNYNQVALNVAPPAPVSLTITSSNPAVATLIAGTGNTGGTATITFSNLSNTYSQYFSIVGVKGGTSTITVTAPGYTTNTSTVTVSP